MTLRSTLTAAVAAAALAFGSAAPAAADPDTQDLIAFLAGVAALSIIANGVNQPEPTYYPQPTPVYPQPYPVYPRPVYPHPQPTPTPHYSGLPTKCAIKFQTRNGWERGYTSDCLARAGLSRGLPSHCLRELRTTSGWNRIYGDYCLRQAGY